MHHIPHDIQSILIKSILYLLPPFPLANWDLTSISETQLLLSLRLVNLVSGSNSILNSFFSHSSWIWCETIGVSNYA